MHARFASAVFLLGSEFLCRILSRSYEISGYFLTLAVMGQVVSTATLWCMSPPSPPNMSYLFIKLTVNPSQVYVSTIWKNTS